MRKTCFFLIFFIISNNLFCITNIITDYNDKSHISILIDLLFPGAWTTCLRHLSISLWCMATTCARVILRENNQKMAVTGAVAMCGFGLSPDGGLNVAWGRKPHLRWICPVAARQFLYRQAAGHMGASPELENKSRSCQCDWFWADPLGMDRKPGRAVEFFHCRSCLWARWQLHCLAAWLRGRIAAEVSADRWTLLVLLRTRRFPSQSSSRSREWQQREVQDALRLPMRLAEWRLRQREIRGLSGQRRRTGWWFGCHFLFSHILGIIIPIDFHIFQRGGPTTNQRTTSWDRRGWTEVRAAWDVSHRGVSSRRVAGPGDRTATAAAMDGVPPEPWRGTLPHLHGQSRLRNFGRLVRALHQEWCRDTSSFQQRTCRQELAKYKNKQFKSMEYSTKEVALPIPFTSDRESIKIFCS